MTGAPRIAVATIGYPDARECRSVLRELARQTIASEMEVFVCSPSAEGIEPESMAAFPRWEHIQPGDARQVGISLATAFRASTAPIFTYAEEHSYFADDWAERIVAAHEAGHRIIGFAMENANPETLVSWAHLYAQFGPSVAPVESGPVDALTGHHTAYDRGVLEGYGERLAEMLEDECALFVDQRAKGTVFWMAGDAISRHVHISRLPALMALEWHGQRGFAGARARTGGWGFGKRLLWAAALPLFPVVRMRRAVGHLRRTGRGKQFLPAILLPMAAAYAAGAVGESFGYIFGGGDSAVRKSPLELNREDFTAGSDPWRAAGGKDRGA